MTQFQNWRDPSLIQSSDSLSAVKTSLKDVFREIYDLTGLAKFKACIEIIDNLL